MPMDPVAIDRHAQAVRSVLAILGPRLRLRVLLMLQGLGLSEAEARSVVQHALARRILDAERSDPNTLRAGTWSTSGTEKGA